MVLKIYSVYDSKAEAHLRPMFMQSKGQAIRAFQDLCNEPGHEFSKHAEDYTLFELGEWDDLSSQFELHKAKISLGCGVEFKKI